MIPRTGADAGSPSDPHPRAPRRDASDNRAALLAAAKTLLNVDSAASLEAIAVAAGLTRRSVYGHFASRDELIRELVTSGAERVAAAIATVSHPEPLVRLALLSARLWSEIESVRIMALVAVRGPHAQHTAMAFASIRRQVDGALIEGQNDGTVRTDIEPARLARLIERAALDVLAEANEHPLSLAEGHRLAMLVTLSVAGLGARESAELIDSSPALDLLSVRQVTP